MIRQIHDTTSDPADIHSQLADHQAEMIRRCPYLGPSVHRGLTVWSAYSAEPGDQRGLLKLLVTYAEAVREVRQRHGSLVCRNIAIFGPQDVEAAQTLMDWPAWLARNLYAPVQIIVDRFWIGQGRRNDIHQSQMPPPAVSFFMVRSRIARRDRVIASPKILPQLLQQASQEDDGRDVFVHSLGKPCDDPATTWPQLTAAFPIE